MISYQEQNLNLFRADCLQFLKALDDNSIDLIATDPPYFKVKKDDWDNQWPNKKAFFDWLNNVLIEFDRVLKPTGSLYLFAGPHLATETEVIVAKHFDVLNQIIWRKESGRHKACRKESLRRYFPQTEHIIFAESKKPTPFAFEPIRTILVDAINKAGVSRAQVDEACGCQMSGHWFGKSQWSMPSKQHYNTINKLTNNGLPPYADIYQVYRDLLDGKNNARRAFNMTKEVPFTNVWDFDVVQYYEGKHPCEKPLDLMSHIIKASSNEGDAVLDTFVGSGATAVVCKQTARKFYGCEMGKHEFKQAVARIRSI